MFPLPLSTSFHFLYFPSSSLFFIIFGTSPSTNRSTPIWISYSFLSKISFILKRQKLYAPSVFFFSFFPFLILPSLVTISRFPQHLPFFCLTTNSFHLICRSIFGALPGQIFTLTFFLFSQWNILFSTSSLSCIFFPHN